MTTEQLELNLAPQIIEAFKICNGLATEAKEYASEAVAKAVECGQLLLRQKESLVHGGWLNWLDNNVPEMSDRTAQRYMALAKKTSHVSFLDDASTMRQAYIATGILPKPVEKEVGPPDPNAPWVKFIRPLEAFRLWYQRRIKQGDIDTWDVNGRRVLKNELKWIADLYERL